MSAESGVWSPESRVEHPVSTRRRRLRTPDSGLWTRERGVQLPLLPEVVDHVPELTHYRDEGCRFWHACLSCPFARCVFEEPGGPKRAVNAVRDGEIRRRHAAGETPQAIAAHFGVTRRTVYRVLGGVRRQRVAERQKPIGKAVGSGQ